jgi:hypothetical protein
MVEERTYCETLIANRMREVIEEKEGKRSGKYHPLHGKASSTSRRFCRKLTLKEDKKADPFKGRNR